MVGVGLSPGESRLDRAGRDGAGARGAAFARVCPVLVQVEVVLAIPRLAPALLPALSVSLAVSISSSSSSVVVRPTVRDVEELVVATSADSNSTRLLPSILHALAHALSLVSHVCVAVVRRVRALQRRLRLLLLLLLFV